MIQAPALARLIDGGLPTEALVIDVVVSKYAWHLLLCRQSQTLATEGAISIARRLPIGGVRSLRAQARLPATDRDPEVV